MHDAQNVLSIMGYHHKPANVAAQCADTHKYKIIRGSPPQLKLVPVIGTCLNFCKAKNRLADRQLVTAASNSWLGDSPSPAPSGAAGRNRCAGAIAVEHHADAADNDYRQQDLEYGEVLEQELPDHDVVVNLVLNPYMNRLRLSGGTR